MVQPTLQQITNYCMRASVNTFLKKKNKHALPQKKKKKKKKKLIMQLLEERKLPNKRGLSH